jgi:membrane protein YdbS with pleckstrin-like domain
MKDLKVKVKAVWAITQTLVMFLVGLGSVAAGLLFDQREDLRFVALSVGTVCSVIGFVPLVAAFVKDNWPKKVK